MRPPLVPIADGACCLLKLAALAASLAALPGKVAGQQLIRAAPGVNAQLARLEFRVLGGRIHAAKEGSGGRLSFGAKSLGREENLSIDLSGEFPSIDYAIISRKSRVQITISDGDRVIITCHPQAHSAVVPMRFEQIPSTRLLLRLGTDEKQREFRAETIWHLLIIEPEAASKHLLPLLEILRPDWPLRQQAAEVEELLIALAESYQPPNSQRLDQLIAQLGDDQFGRRQEAERNLRESGPAILPYLKGLASEQLDAEQRFRIRRIIRGFVAAAVEDEPAQVARRLQNDRAIWLALLSRPQRDKREAAARHLRKLLGREINFDPALEPDQSAPQAAALREALATQADN
jgi:hypothetical protein